MSTVQLFSSPTHLVTRAGGGSVNTTPDSGVSGLSTESTLGYGQTMVKVQALMDEVVSELPHIYL